MVQSKGSIWRNVAIKLKNTKNSVKRAVFGSLARIRFRKIVFDENELERKIISVSVSRLVTLKMLQEIITRNIETHGEKIIIETLKECITILERRQSERALYALYVASIRAIGEANLSSGIQFGELYLDSIGDKRGIESLITFYQRRGDIKKPYKLLKKIEDSNWKETQKRKLELELNLLKEGVAYDEEAEQIIEIAPKNIMYHVNQSLPHHSSGYAIRTQSLLKSLKSKNWNISAYARVGYPNDRYDYIGSKIVDSYSTVDGIDYYFTPSRTKSIGKLDIKQYQKESINLILKQAKKFNPSIIHSASNYSCGLAATASAKILGIPSIYEMRGLWHVTRTAKQPEYDESDHYRMIEALEIQAAKNASHVFTITDSVKNILLKNGIEKEKITLLPNAVDIDKFAPREKNERIEQKFGLKGMTTIGYIGSFTDYEGLDYLLKAGAKLKEKYEGKFKLLMVGDGVVLDNLKNLSKELKLDNDVHFTGRIDHNDVFDYYSVIDIAVYPRKGTKVCEIVSPLKPLEAMAMEKTVITSNVKALSEMMKDNETGLLHAKDDIDDLTRLLEKCLRDKKLTKNLGINARKWVINNRNWDAVSERVNNLYKKLIKESR